MYYMRSNFLRYVELYRALGSSLTSGIGVLRVKRGRSYYPSYKAREVTSLKDHQHRRRSPEIHLERRRNLFVCE